MVCVAVVDDAAANVVLIADTVASSSNVRAAAVKLVVENVSDPVRKVS